MMQGKECTKCGETYPLTPEYWYRDKSKLSGFAPRCKLCRSAGDKQFRENHSEEIKLRKKRDKDKIRAQERMYREQNREIIRERARRYRLAHLEEVKARQQEWRKNNPDYFKEYRCRNIDRIEARRKAHYSKYRDSRLEYEKKYRAGNKEAIAQRGKSWRRRNPEKARAASHRRRSRVFGTSGEWTKDDATLMFSNQKGKCWWCGKKIRGTYHVDHIIPLARGGSNAPNNLCISCPPCNMSKGAKLPSEWAGRLF